MRDWQRSLSSAYVSNMFFGSRSFPQFAIASSHVLMYIAAIHHSAALVRACHVDIGNFESTMVCGGEALPSANHDDAKVLKSCGARLGRKGAARLLMEQQ